MTKVFIAHADGEEAEAEKLAEPLSKEGHEVIHHGTVLVGESLLTEAQKVLNAGGPVVICATCRAAGSKWIRRIANAARKSGSGHLFVMQMEAEADVDDLVLGEQAGAYWKDPKRAVQGLVDALRKYYPPGETALAALQQRAEATYRRLVLESCDIISLANLPEGDRHIATRKLEVRSLYVPLKVRAERHSEPWPSEARWAEMEEHYEAARLDSGYSPEPETDRFSVGKRLALAQRLLVLGDPGAGKSTLLRWIATAYLLRLKQDPDLGSVPEVATLPSRDWLPILIRCRDLDPEAIGGPLDDMLRHTLRKSEMSAEEAEALRTVLREKLAHGEAILLVDGLDEIANTAARIRFCEQLDQIQLAFPDAAIVVTSRLVGYGEMGNHRIGAGFEHALVDDLLPLEKDGFVRRWCELTEVPERRDTAAEELIRDIHSTDRIERLTGNPMLLTTMALVKRRVGRLPRRRAELYGEAVQVLLNWRQAETEQPLDPREARPQLQYLAYAMCDHGVQRLREDEVLALLSQLRSEYRHLHAVSQHAPEQFLELLQRRTGIFVQTGLEPHLGMQVPVYEFRHLTFQEYLAARALVEQCYPGARPGSRAETIAPLAARRASRPGEQRHEGLQWHEVIRLFVACCPSNEVDPVLRAILELRPGEDATETARSRAVCAALCLADEPDVSEPLALEILARLGRLIEPREDIAALQEAFQELMASRWRDQALSVLAREFLARDVDDRSSVLGILGICQQRPLFYEDEEQENQWLADLRPPVEAAKAVVAAAALAEAASNGWGNLEVVPHLLTLLERGGALSHAAAHALYALYAGYRIRFWVPDEKESRRLGAVVADTKSDLGAVRDTIVLLGDARATHAAEQLRSRLTDADDEIRGAATKAAGQLGDAQSTELLILRLDDRVSGIRAAAAESLGLLRSWEALRALQQRLGDIHPQVRADALAALWRLLGLRLKPQAPGMQPTNLVPGWGPEEASALAQTLIPMLDDPSESGIPRLAANLLGLLKPREAVEPLMARFLAHQKKPRPQWNVDFESMALAHALGELGDPRAVAPLQQRFDTSSSDLQSVIIPAVCKLMGHQSMDWLVSQLRQDIRVVQLAAAAGLTRLGDARGARVLEQAIQSEEEELRRQALGAWATIHGDLDDVELVTTFVRDYGHPIDPSREVELSDVELVADWLGFPREEARERLEWLSERIPLKLAWPSRTTSSTRDAQLALRRT